MDNAATPKTGDSGVYFSRRSSRSSSYQEPLAFKTRQTRIRSPRSVDEGIGSPTSTGESRKTLNSRSKYGSNATLYSRYPLPKSAAYTGYYDRPSTPRPSTSMQKSVSELTKQIFKGAREGNMNLNKFDEMVNQLYVALKKEIDNHRKIVIMATPLEQTGCSTEWLSPTPFSCVDLVSCQSQCSQEYTDRRIWIILPDKALYLDSPEAYSEFLSYTRNHHQLQLPNEITNGIQKEIEFERGIEVTTDQKLVLTPVLQKNELHLIVQSTTSGNYTLITYNMTDSFHRSSQELNPKSTSMLSTAACKMFCLNNEISIMTGKLHNRMWRSSSYYLDTQASLATWKHISYLTLSISELFLDFENSFVIPYKDDTIILVSVVNDSMHFNVICKGIHGKKSVSTNVSLSQLNIRSAPTKFKMQSCIILSNNIYCSLWQQGIGVRICQFNIKIMQQLQKITSTVRLTSSWQINDNSTLQSCNCFISVHNSKIIIICCDIADGKSIIEIKQLNYDAKVVLPSESRFAFPYTVRVVAASVIPQSQNLVVAVTYQDSKSNNYYIKRLNMSLYIYNQSPPTPDSVAKPDC